MGVVDTFLQPADAFPELNSYRYDLYRCIDDMNPTPDDLRDIIDRAYEDDSMLESSPDFVLTAALHQMCLDHMNRARAMHGEEPLK